jgi:hypothetical protein
MLLGLNFPKPDVARLLMRFSELATQFKKACDSLPIALKLSLDLVCEKPDI